MDGVGRNRLLSLDFGKQFIGVRFEVFQIRLTIGSLESAPSLGQTE